MNTLTQTISTQIELASRPAGMPTPENFRTVAVELSEPAPGEVRVSNQFLSVDPYMRGRMSATKSYVAPYELGETLSGGALGTVTESRSEHLPVGTVVTSQLGWRDIAQGPAEHFTAQDVDPALPASLYLGVLGMPGLTAYVGLAEIAGIQPGDTVFISGAAGAVGSAAGQIARLLGAKRVIGSAGSDDKVALLREKYGFDAALNYRAGPIRQQLAHAAPEGIDVYFDNVGGDHLEAALDVLGQHGRVAVCGAISQYNDQAPQPGPDNLAQIVRKSLRLQGFIVGDHLTHATEYRRQLQEWVRTGQLVWEETVVDGLGNAPAALTALLAGDNTGKMLVRL